MLLFSRQMPCKSHYKKYQWRNTCAHHKSNSHLHSKAQAGSKMTFFPKITYSKLMTIISAQFSFKYLSFTIQIKFNTKIKICAQKSIGFFFISTQTVLSLSFCCEFKKSMELINRFHLSPQSQGTHSKLSSFDRSTGLAHWSSMEPNLFATGKYF